MARLDLKNALSAAGLTLVPILAFAQAETQAGADYLIVFSGMVLGLVTVALVLATIARVKKARYETIQAMVEKGREIPEQLLGPRHPQFPPREKLTLEEHRGYSLGWGVLLSFLGLGVGLAGFLSSGEIRSAAWGLIFLFLGLGWLTNSALIARHIRRQAKDGGR